jgi:hypothetical protein
VRYRNEHAKRAFVQAVASSFGKRSGIDAAFYRMSESEDTEKDSGHFRREQTRREGPRLARGQQQ